MWSDIPSLGWEPASDTPPLCRPGTSGRVGSTLKSLGNRLSILSSQVNFGIFLWVWIFGVFFLPKTLLHLFTALRLCMHVLQLLCERCQFSLPCAQIKCRPLLTEPSSSPTLRPLLLYFMTHIFLYLLGLGTGFLCVVLAALELAM